MPLPTHYEVVIRVVFAFAETLRTAPRTLLPIILHTSYLHAYVVGEPAAPQGVDAIILCRSQGPLRRRGLAAAAQS